MREEPQEVQCQKDFYDKNDKRHTLIFIHGMGQTRSNAPYPCPKRNGNTPYPTIDADYKSLWELIKSEWTLRNPTLNFNDFYKPLFVDWLYITDTEQELLYRLAYGKNPQKSMNFLKIITHLYESMSTFFITKLGDVIAYTDDNNNGIRDAVWSQVKDVCTKGCYSIIAHSLGSVIAYDFVLKTQHHPKFPPFVMNNDYLKNIPTIAKNFRGLFTFGSPIGIFFLRKFDLFEPQPIPTKLGIDYPIINSELPWLNFHNPRDPISVPLSGVFASNGQPGPKDIELKFGFPLKAHTGYWGKREMARKIALNLK